MGFLTTIASRRHRADVAICVAVLVATTFLTVTAPRWLPYLSVVETWWSDFRREHVGPRLPRDERIVILTVGLSALAPYPYMLPFDRGMLADAIEALAERNVKALGVDIFFSTPTEPAKDRRLKDVLEAFPAPVVVSWAEAGPGMPPNEAKYLAAFAAKLGKGWPNLIKDDKGVVRWLGTTLGPEGATIRRTLVAALADALDVPVQDGMARLDFRMLDDEGKPAFAVYPIEFAAKLDPTWLAGKIVLIGAAFSGTDEHSVPSYATGVRDKPIPGVLVHAHALSQILDGRVVPEASMEWRSALAAGAVLAGIAMALAPMGWWARVLGGTLAVVVLAGIGFLSVRQGGPDLPLAAPVLGFLGAYGGGIAFVGRRLNREKRFIRQAFAQYVAPAVVAELEAEPGGLKLGGERREITAVFTDVAGFTNFSERMDPQALGELLNRYFDGLCDAVVAHEGTIDKFVGDALVALFGAPAAREDHAERALACALAIDAFSEDFRRTEVARGIPFGITRIGVNTGPATVGNFGGRVRFNYTALGDTINTASRLEGANKQFGTRICVSTTTAERCGLERFRPIGAIVVKGKDDPVAVYEPAPAGSMNGHTAAWPGYRMAYGLMERGDAGARDAFADLARQFPDDGLIAFHLQRLQDGVRGITIKLSEK